MVKFTAKAKKMPKTLIDKKCISAEFDNTYVPMPVNISS